MNKVDTEEFGLFVARTLVYAVSLALCTALMCWMFGDFTGNIPISAFIAGGFGYWNGYRKGKSGE